MFRKLLTGGPHRELWRNVFLAPAPQFRKINLLTIQIECDEVVRICVSRFG